MPPDGRDRLVVCRRRFGWLAFRSVYFVGEQCSEVAQACGGKYKQSGSSPWLRRVSPRLNAKPPLRGQWARNKSMLRILLPFTIGLLLMMLGVLESSRLSGRAVEIGHDAVLERENTREQLIKLGIFGASLTEAMIRRGKGTVIFLGKKPIDEASFQKNTAAAP